MKCFHGWPILSKGALNIFAHQLDGAGSNLSIKINFNGLLDEFIWPLALLGRGKENKKGLTVVLGINK